MPRGPRSEYVRDDAGREVFWPCQEKVKRNGRTVYRYTLGMTIRATAARNIMTACSTCSESVCSDGDAPPKVDEEM